MRRQGMDEASIAKRRADRPAERAAQDRFDHVIVNREGALGADRGRRAHPHRGGARRPGRAPVVV
ncbi:MAG: hypothetical protein U0360_04020 [Dehalococcoidia bacterium]